MRLEDLMFRHKGLLGNTLTPLITFIISEQVLGVNRLNWQRRWEFRLFVTTQLVTQITIGGLRNPLLENQEASSIWSD